ncbi:apolipoprotein N-acyltransferase, partial [Nakamurella flavida]
MATPTLHDGSDPAGGSTHDVPADALARARRDRRRLRRQGRLRRLLGAGGLRILVAVLGGLALYASYAPSTLWWLAPVGLGLLGLAVHGRRIRPALGLGLLFGLSFYVPLLIWTSVYIGPVAVSLAVLEAMLTAPVAAALAFSSRRAAHWRPGTATVLWPLWAAALWVAGEALRARFPFGGFPWGGIAFSQPDGPLLPAASLIGATGLAFLTALAGFALTGLARAGWAARGRWRPARPLLLLAVVALIAPFVVGVAGRATVQTGEDAPRSVIAVIQGNVPEPGLEFNATRRAVTQLHADRTRALAAAVRAGTAPAPRLVVWPENSSDIDPYRDPVAAEMISDAARDIGVPILVGAVVDASDDPDDRGSYNMGIVWDPQTGPGQTYTKRHPVPFAEYMPWRSFFRLFTSWVDRAGFFLPGDAPGNLDVAGVPVGDVICFEVVYENLVRDVVAGGAQVLVVQTNNATFGWTDETYQQQAMSRVRAVENGREVLIAATSGVSAVIAPTGAVESSIPLFTPGYLTPSVPLISTTTPGTVLGAPVEWGLTGAAMLALVWQAIVSMRRGRPDRRTPDGAGT